MLTGCTTTGRFVIPEGTQLEVYRRPVTVQARALPKGATEFRLSKNEEAIQEGRLHATFRVASIFRLPILNAVIYWPMGFNPSITHDPVRETHE
ncbi:MAG: hypothetical protein GY725_08440 [bacterium]|nr:hypothetical protein [bacterium]